MEERKVGCKVLMTPEYFSLDLERDCYLTFLLVPESLYFAESGKCSQSPIECEAKKLNVCTKNGDKAWSPLAPSHPHFLCSHLFFSLHTQRDSVNARQTLQKSRDCSWSSTTYMSQFLEQLVFQSLFSQCLQKKNTCYHSMQAVVYGTEILFL